MTSSKIGRGLGPHKIRRGGASMLLCVALASGALGIAQVASTGTALAAGPGTVYVSHSGSASASGRNCNSARYSSVQAAVDAAPPGGTVYLCGTTPYTEEVVVTKSLAITGDEGASLEAPSDPSAYTTAGFPSAFTTEDLAVPQAILVVTGSGVDASVSGIGISGPLPSNCSADEFGVLVIGGATVEMQNDSVSNIADVNTADLGCQFGVAIEVGREYWPTQGFGNYLVEDFVGHADISGTTVSGYQKNGVTVDGPGSTADIGTSSVTGFGETSVTAQNGIQISRGAVADVHNDSISGNQYTGAGEASATGVLVFGGCGDPNVIGADIHNNALSNNDIGIYLGNYDPSCSTYAPQPTSVSVHNNRLSDDVQSNISGNVTQGYQAGITDVGNGDEIHNNQISGVGYTPAVTSPTAPCYVIPIDLSLSYDASVHNNNVH